ncbi:hypothetical protein Ae201684P_017327 [Aphanomyces euteiches]|nr:hypothetical protein Ae201684P_017327 [Aphanomyces euteiches]
MDVGGTTSNSKPVCSTRWRKLQGEPHGENALLFDNNLQKKPQFAACADVIKAGPAPTTKPSSAPTPLRQPLQSPSRQPSRRRHLNPHRQPHHLLKHQALHRQSPLPNHLPPVRFLHHF